MRFCPPQLKINLPYIYSYQHNSCSPFHVHKTTDAADIWPLMQSNVYNSLFLKSELNEQYCHVSYNVPSFDFICFSPHIFRIHLDPLAPAHKYASKTLPSWNTLNSLLTCCPGTRILPTSSVNIQLKKKGYIQSQRQEFNKTITYHTLIFVGHKLVVNPQELNSIFKLLCFEPIINEIISMGYTTGCYGYAIYNCIAKLAISVICKLTFVVFSDVCSYYYFNGIHIQIIQTACNHITSEMYQSNSKVYFDFRCMNDLCFTYGYGGDEYYVCCYNFDQRYFRKIQHFPWFFANLDLPNNLFYIMSYAHIKDIFENTKPSSLIIEIFS